MGVKVKGQGETTKEPAKKKLVGELDAVLAAIRKHKGENVVVQAEIIPDVERIPTGIFEFDRATNGGFPRGRQSIVYGPESSGKTNHCLAACAKAQRLPEECNRVVWVNLEGTFDPKWAARFGVDTTKLVVINPAYGEEAVDLTLAVLQADDVVLVIIDSVAVMVSAKEAAQSTETADVGSSALLVKRLTNKIAIAQAVEARRGHFPAVVFVNQTRFKIGVLHGDPETTPGGQAIKFNSSLTVRLSAKDVIEKAVHPDKPAFKQTRCVIKKAKVPINAKETEYKLAMVASPGVAIGETDSWSSVRSILTDAGQLVKLDKNKGYEVLGLTFDKLGDMQDCYYTDSDFRLKMQMTAISCSGGAPMLVEAEGFAAK